MDVAGNYIVPRFITSLGPFTNMPQIAVMGAAVGNLSSATWPTANKALYYPFWLPFHYPVKRMFLMNGTGVSGNIDIGVYSHDGAKIYSPGATVQAGVSSAQYFSPDIMLAPGRYYFGCVLSSATGTTIRASAGGVPQMRMCGVFEQVLASANLPANWTASILTSTYWTLMGLTNTTTGF